MFSNVRAFLQLLLDIDNGLIVPCGYMVAKGCCIRAKWLFKCLMNTFSFSYIILIYICNHFIIIMKISTLFKMNFILISHSNLNAYVSVLAKSLNCPF